MPQYIKKSREAVKKAVNKAEPPLFAFSISNPLTYIKSWFLRITRNEGVDFKIKIRPLTAIGIAFAIAAGSAGLATVATVYSVSSKIPFVGQFVPTMSPTPSPPPPSPTPNPTVKMGLTGILKLAGSDYYLVTQGSTYAVQNMSGVDLRIYLNKRVFALGDLNTKTMLFTLGADSQIETFISTRIVKSPVPSPTEALIQSSSIQ